jgi:thioredoxin 1
MRIKTMSEQVLQLDDTNFTDHTAQGVALVDFWAPWCGPCRMQGPIIDQVAETVGSKAKVAKVNVDEAPSVASSFGVQSIPTLLVLKDGQVVQKYVGVQNQEKLLEAINQASG